VLPEFQDVGKLEPWELKIKLHFVISVCLLPSHLSVLQAKWKMLITAFPVHLKCAPTSSACAPKIFSKGLHCSQ